LLASCTLIMYDNYITTKVNVRPNQRLLRNYLSIMISIDATNCAIRLSLYIYIYLWMLFKRCIIIFHYIATHNIMLPYKLAKPFTFIEGESLLLKWNLNNLYNISQIQLRCTYGYTFINSDVFYLNVLLFH